ncbi:MULTISPECIES: TrbG/VirB9 family P-type conjugative transfer protein [Sphingomonas]|uniref:TrbG/VirB9 family P-type conjugative transfer protein n=1 Tax=Sphingomonas TaxID=13687 RepID=UPI000DEFF067|nr:MULTISPECIES: TrbG/VirB9 family P-type conjugative transfer protein [Sphingomonas]
MKFVFIMAGAALAVPSAASGQSYSQDPRVQTVAYAPGGVVSIRGAPGYEITVELSPDEQVQNIAMGDSSMWQAAANRRGDFLFLKPLVSDGSTNMTVVTNVRIYNFELIASSSNGSSSPWHLQFSYPATTSSMVQQTEPTIGPHPAGIYRVSGDAKLRPASVRDDGNRTYISWPSDQALPAVFTINDDGNEALVDGMMRDDVMVIDRVVPKLVFRMDERVARAERMPLKRRR